MTYTDAAGALNLVSPSDRRRAVLVAFDATDVSMLAAHMTDDVRLRLGNAETVEGKTAFVDALNAFLASVAGFRHEIIDVRSYGDALITELDVHTSAQGST